MMKVEALDLKSQYQPMRAEIETALFEVIESQQFILGPAVEKFEQRIADYCQSSFAIGVSSGTDALLVSLMALGIGPGDEVITTPYSFFATASVIARLGARPVFVDIDPVSYNLNPAGIERVLTKKAKVILPVHLYGQCAEMQPILEIAQKHHLKVVEDAAQAIGANYREEKCAGAMGDLGCFSFFPSKNLGAFGDAGMVVTQDAELAQRVRIMRVQGATSKYHHGVLGGNFRIDTLQAAVLDVKLNYLSAWTAGRQEVAQHYDSLFEDSGLKQKGLSAPEPVYLAQGVTHYHTYHQYVIRAPRRDALKEHLKRQGISTQIYYPEPLHLQVCLNDLGYAAGDFPQAERAAKETLALPIYPEMDQAKQSMIVEEIQKFYA